MFIECLTQAESFFSFLSKLLSTRVLSFCENQYPQKKKQKYLQFTNFFIVFERTVWQRYDRVLTQISVKTKKKTKNITTLLQRPYDVHNVQITLKQRHSVVLPTKNTDT